MPTGPPGICISLMLHMSKELKCISGVLQFRLLRSKHVEASTYCLLCVSC